MLRHQTDGPRADDEGGLDRKVAGEVYYMHAVGEGLRHRGCFRGQLGRPRDQHLGGDVDEFGESSRAVHAEDLAVGAEMGVTAAAADAAMKERLRAVTDEALGRGIFGSPFVIVDGEPFWGADRLPMVDEWLRRGGW